MKFWVKIVGWNEVCTEPKYPFASFAATDVARKKNTTGDTLVHVRDEDGNETSWIVSHTSIYYARPQP